MTNQNIAPKIKEEDKVPFWKKIAYAAGGPVDILGVWVMVSIAYQVFNFELKMSPTYVAIILMSLRLWDGVMDPLMGWISDNFRSKWGRRRPFILVGAILCGLTYPLIWWFPSDYSQEAIMFWVIGFGVIFYTAFTIWAMPYQSMLMEMTPDYNERTRVAEFRGYFQTVAGFLNGWMWWISMLPIFFIDGAASPVNGMRYLSIGIGVLMLVFGVLPAIFVEERYYQSDIVKNQKSIGLVDSLKQTLTNRPFLILCALTIFFLLGTSIFDSYGRYVGTYYVLGGDWNEGAKFAGYGTVIYMLFSFIFIPLFRNLSEKIGKPKVLMTSIVLVLIAVSTTWWTFTPDNKWLMLLNTAFIGAGYAGLWLMIPSMQVDVVDYDELKSGERREGSYASIFSWVLKLSFVIGFMISGPLIEWTGFDAALNNNQAEGVYTTMRIGYLVIPIVALLIALYLLKIFPITAEKAAEIRHTLEDRRGKV
jgi:glycoside/pentoside/hexuronide:cation symporter, GPH family